MVRVLILSLIIAGLSSVGCTKTPQTDDEDQLPPVLTSSASSKAIDVSGGYEKFTGNQVDAKAALSLRNRKLRGSQWDATVSLGQDRQN